MFIRSYRLFEIIFYGRLIVLLINVTAEMENILEKFKSYG
jgi:hypothetical protein